MRTSTLTVLLTAIATLSVTTPAPAKSIWVKVRDTATHPVAMVVKKIDQIGDVPKKTDQAADAAKAAAEQAKVSTQELTAQTVKTEQQAVATAKAAEKTAVQGQETLQEGKTVLHSVGLALEVLIWSLVALVGVKILRQFSPAGKPQRGPARAL